MELFISPEIQMKKDQATKYDNPLKERIRKHLSDRNDVITDADIRDLPIIINAATTEQHARNAN